LKVKKIRGQLNAKFPCRYFVRRRIMRCRAGQG
jgi:hypothetical protein